MLKTLYHNTQDEWLYVWDHYQDFHTKESIEELIAEAVAEVKSVCDGKNAAYSWSGGKDSIALQIVCEDAGIKKGFCCYNDLYFKQSIEFFNTHCPEGIELHNTGENMVWLSQHQEWLFPKDGHKWNMRTHLKYQPVYCKQNNIDVLMMGKRTIDGNNIAKELVFHKTNGVNLYCPIRHWSHEDVLCALRYRNKELSDLYFTDNGFYYGDTCLARMKPLKGERFEDTWKRFYKIDPDKVLLAAKLGIDSAFRALEEIYNGD